MSRLGANRRERRRLLFDDYRDLLILALLPLLLYLTAQRYVPTDWYSRVTTFLCFNEPIIIHSMGDGSVQEITDIGTDAYSYFPAITARGGVDVLVSRSYSLSDSIFPRNSVKSAPR